MSQESVDVKRVALSSVETFDDTFLKVKDILDSQVYLHEIMMRSSVLYKTIYMDMLEKTKALEVKLQPMSPPFLKWLTDYTNLIGSFPSATKEDRTSVSGTVQETSVLQKKKRTRKTMEEDLFQPVVKKPKKQQVKKAKVMVNNSTLPSIDKEHNIPPTEANLDVSSEVNLLMDEDTIVADCQPIGSTTLNNWWQDYSQLMEDIKQRESNAVEDDPYEEHNLTPLQKNCSVCRHNNMLRYISCNSGQVQCHVCCMDLMNCMCYRDPEGMMDDTISQDFHGHILTI